VDVVPNSIATNRAGQMSRLENGELRVPDGPERLPHTYTLQARKP
jgi:hypothetical protein